MVAAPVHPPCSSSLVVLKARFLLERKVRFSQASAALPHTRAASLAPCWGCRRKGRAGPSRALPRPVRTRREVGQGREEHGPGGAVWTGKLWSGPGAGRAEHEPWCRVALPAVPMDAFWAPLPESRARSNTGRPRSGRQPRRPPRGQPGRLPQLPYCLISPALLPDLIIMGWKVGSLGRHE